MTEATTAAPVERELRLKFTVDGEAWFKVGGAGANCDAIERVDGGYEVHRGPEVVRVEAPDVQYFRQSPRPGYAQERRDAASTVPRFAEPQADGSFRCRDCGVTKRTLHAMRIHYGKTHSAER